MRRFSTVAAALVLLLIVTSPITAIWLIKQQADAIVSDSLCGLVSSSMARRSVSDGFLATVLAVHGGAMDRASLGSRVEVTSHEVDEQYETYRLTMRTRAEREAFDRLLKRRADYRDCRSRVFALLEEGRHEEAAGLFDQECVRLFNTYSTALNEVVEKNAHEARLRGGEIVRLCYILLGIQALLFVFFFVYGFFVPLTALLERLTRRPIQYRS